MSGVSMFVGPTRVLCRDRTGREAAVVIDFGETDIWDMPLQDALDVFARKLGEARLKLLVELLKQGAPLAPETSAVFEWSKAKAWQGE